MTRVVGVETCSTRKERLISVNERQKELAEAIKTRGREEGADGVVVVFCDCGLIPVFQDGGNPTGQGWVGKTTSDAAQERETKEKKQ